MFKNTYMARPNQSLHDHLLGVGNLAGKFAEKIGLGDHGQLIGLLHDLGKYSSAFQAYLGANLDSSNPDEDNNDESSISKKIDHSTAGAQWIWDKLRQSDKSYAAQGCTEILALCIASHHSGLIDCLNSNGENNFRIRINKDFQQTNYNECCKNIDINLLQKIENLVNKDLVIQFKEKISKIISQETQSTIKHFNIGFLVKFLFSCLIDGDRIDSASVENPIIYQELQSRKYDWAVAIERFEKRNSEFKIQCTIDKIRKEISDHCYQKASVPQDIYTLTVPTGGGKTFASLRYALHHANFHKLDRIIYIIPYTSIIDQNASAIRSLIEEEGDKYPWVLEHHSNLEPEKQTWHSKITSDNWDAPIILTTMVQFLEVLFGGRTRGPRRLHQLANSVLIFDEVQTLPLKCIHLFCNAINFLVKHTKTTAVLCTATQPALNELKTPEKGQLIIPKENELAKDVKKLFDDLNRVEIINQCKATGWKDNEIIELTMSEFTTKSNCLVIVNTKKSAATLFRKCKEHVSKDAIFHLSTYQYPAHRKEILGKIKERLKQKLPVLCISTQLIEAGVDISFATVIRFLAGLDSIAQAAGRCNRHGELKDKDGNPIKGIVYVINSQEEDLTGLDDIKQGQIKTYRIFNDMIPCASLLNPEIIRNYFCYYFDEHSSKMDYRLSKEAIGFETTLLELLAKNNDNIAKPDSQVLLRQSFKTAGQQFEVIDAPTKAIIIQHGKGKEIITELCAIVKKFNPKRYYELIREAQNYSVNVFPNTLKELHKQKALFPIQEEEQVLFLDECYYSEEFGLSTEHVSTMGSLAF